jgi:hypothetical protein
MTSVPGRAIPRTAGCKAVKHVPLISGEPLRRRAHVSLCKLREAQPLLPDRLANAIQVRSSTNEDLAIGDCR